MEQIDTEYRSNIGKVVRKRSKKPFKSGNVTNTVNNVTVNPYTNKVAYTFDEDDSIVDAYICRLVEQS